MSKRIALCPKCQREVSIHDSVCPHCGQTLFNINKIDVKECPKCRAQLNIGQYICPLCGKIVGENDEDYFD